MKRVGDIVVIEDGPVSNCQLCGKPDELRPYGPEGKWICWDCGDKTPETRAIRDAAIGAILDSKGSKSS